MHKGWRAGPGHIPQRIAPVSFPAQILDSTISISLPTRRSLSLRVAFVMQICILWHFSRCQLASPCPASQPVVPESALITSAAGDKCGKWKMLAGMAIIPDSSAV